MSQNLVPFFALQAVALAILCIALWLCSKSAQRIAPFYLFFLSLSSEFVGTMLRLMSFFCGTQVLLIGAGRQYDDFWTRVDTSGVLLFAFGLFLKPLFFLSIVETITFKRYLYVSFVFVLFAVLPAIGFRHFGYSTTSSLFAIFLILLTSIFLLVYIQRVPLKKQFLLSVLRLLLYFILALHSIFALYFFYLSSNLVGDSFDFESFRAVDFLLRYVRISAFLCVDAVCLFYWIKNYSTESILAQDNARKLDDLLQEKDLLIQNLIKANALVRTGALAAGISHELNQFLARIQLDVEAAQVYLNRKTEIAKIMTTLNRVLDANKGAAALILNLKKLFIRQNEEMSHCDLEQVVRSVWGLYFDRARHLNVLCELRLQGNVRVLACESLMRQVIANLLGNALDALELTSRSDKKIVIETQLEGDRWILRVEDNGMGIRPENAHKIFNLFATSKNEGTGIGLWLSRFIVEQHGGYMRFSNVEPEGVVFWVDMPVETVQGADKERVSKVLPL